MLTKPIYIFQINEGLTNIHLNNITLDTLILDSCSSPQLAATLSSGVYSGTTKLSIESKNIQGWMTDGTLQTNQVIIATFKKRQCTAHFKH